MYQILKAEKLADKIYLMDVKAPRVACACEPGEFVIVKMDEEGERIPLTICDFNREEGTITIVFHEKAVKKVFDLRPTAIIRDLDLRKPIYRHLAAYGHMGREDLGVAWEKTDRTEALKKAVQG